MRVSEKICVTLVLLWLGGNCQAAATPSWLVKVRTPDGGFCSGVSVGRGYILTAEHCGCKNGASIELADGRKLRAKSIREPGKNGIDEAALMLAETPKLDAVQIADSSPAIGDKVTGYGFTSGAYTEAPGQVAIIGRDFILTEGATAAGPGMSGGALLNADGQLVGLCSGGGGIAKVSDNISAIASLNAQRWISLAEIKVAMSYTDDREHTTNRRLVMFSTPGCIACLDFKAEIKASGHDVTIVETTHSTFNQWHELYRKHTGQRLESFPTFWVENTSFARSDGYRRGLLPSIFDWFAGAIKHVARGVFGDPIPPAKDDQAPEKYEREQVPVESPPAPPAEDAPPQPQVPPGVTASPEAIAILAQALDPKGRPKEPDPEVDWDGVTIVVAASSRIPAVAAAAEGPSKRAIQRFTKGNAILRIVSERTNPDQFSAYEDQLGLAIDQFHVAVLIPETSHSLPVDFIIEKLERLLHNTAENFSKEKVGDIPVEAILERIEAPHYAAVWDIAFDADTDRENSNNGLLSLLLLSVGGLAGPMVARGFASRLEGWALGKVFKRVAESKEVSA